MDPRRQARNEQAKKNARNSKISWIVGIVLLGLFLTYMTHVDNVRQEEESALINAKWNKWVAYRDLNCKVTEKLYGMPMQSGKSSYVDNATVYVCKDSMKYVVSQSVEEKRNSLDSIPEVKQ